MAKKRILVYTENFLPQIGGLENNTYLLCKTLVSLGHIVTLITPQKNATHNKIFTVIENRSLFKLFKEVKSSTFIIINGGVSFKVAIPCFLMRKKYFIIYQMASLFRNMPTNLIKNKIFNQLRYLLALSAYKNIAVSLFSFRELVNIFRENKSSLLINPADEIYDETCLKSEKTSNGLFHCLIGGRLIEGKGVLLLIQAIKELINEGHQLHLHVVGDGPLKAELVNISKEVNFITYYPPMDKFQFKEKLEKMHLTIIPSTTHIEGSPLIMAESFAVGVPVLVSSQPALIASVKHQILVFETGNLKSLKEKIGCLTNPHNYHIAIQHSVALAPVYSYKNYIKSLKSFFKNV